MKIHQMTHYDAGQDLITCYDTLCEKRTDLLNGGFKEQADCLLPLIKEIGKVFNKLHEEEHGFGLGE